MRGLEGGLLSDVGAAAEASRIVVVVDVVPGRLVVAAVAELVRVAKPGGHVHVLAEDYSMLHMMSGPLDPDVFWRKGPVEFSMRTGTDSRIGRRAWTLMRAAGLVDVRVDYVVVDTLRVSRRVFADIITAWRDGYVDPIAEHTQFSREQATAYFNQMIEDIQNPARYALWLVPVASARVP